MKEPRRTLRLSKRHHVSAAQRPFPVARPFQPPPGQIPIANPQVPVAVPLPGQPARPRTRRLLSRVLLALVGVTVFIVGFEAVSRMLGSGPRSRRSPAVAALDSKTPSPLTSVASVRTSATPADSQSAPSKPPTTPSDQASPAPVKPTQAKPGDVPVTYEKHIAGIFQAKCVSCHGAVKPKGSFDMRTLSAILKGGVSGPGLKPGAIPDSLLWTRIDDNSMPPGKSNKLTDMEKQLIQQWIAGGARSNNAIAQKP